MKATMVGYAAAMGLVSAAALCPAAQSLAQENGRPAVVETLEQGFNGFFLLTTNGSGAYDVFQKVEDGLGIAQDANVVCMFHETCFLEVAHMPQNTAEDYDDGKSNLGRLRQRAGAVRDAYAALRAAAADKRPAAADAWHDAIGRFDACLKSKAQC